MDYELPEPSEHGYDARFDLYNADTLRAEVAKAEQRGAVLQDAVIDQLVVAHIYRKEHDSDPRKALQDLISWHVQVALDPQVSSDAQALIDRGAAQRDAKLMEAGKMTLSDMKDVIRSFGYTTHGQSYEIAALIIKIMGQQAIKPLTDEQIFDALEADIIAMEASRSDPETWAVIVGMVRAIEQAHGITGEEAT